MIMSILTVLSLMLFTIILSAVSMKIIKTKLAAQEFRSKCKGIPMADVYRLVTGHLRSVIFKPNVNNHLRNLFDKLNSMNFFIMYGMRPFVFTIDLDLIKTLALDEHHANINRSPLNIPMKELESDCIMLAAGNQWRRIRKAIGPAFTKRRFMASNVLREVNSSIGKLVDSFDRKLNDSANGFIEIEADDYFHRYSLDLTLSCLFNENDRIDINSEKDEITEAFDLGFSHIFGNPFFFLPIVFPIFTPLADSFLIKLFRIGHLKEVVMSFIKMQTKSKLEARKQQLRSKMPSRSNDNDDNIIMKDGSMISQTMMDYVIDHYHDGRINREEYFHSTFFLVGAADKTSADALTQTIYQLALHPDKQDKLLESIRGHGMRSQYLDWVINEALRLQPPVTIGCSRTVERDTATSSGGLIPKGTFVITPSHLIHRLKEFWGQDADTFRPERFAYQESFHPCQFIPFGLGLRQCPGKEFALFEMKSLLITLISRFKFTCKPKKTEAYDSPFFSFNIPLETVVVRLG